MTQRTYRLNRPGEECHLRNAWAAGDMLQLAEGEYWDEAGVVFMQRLNDGRGVLQLVDRRDVEEVPCA